MASNINWQPQGGLAGLTYGNDLVWMRTQDSNGLLTANTVPGVLAQGFVHDDADRLVGLTDALNGALSNSAPVFGRCFLIPAPYLHYTYA